MKVLALLRRAMGRAAAPVELTSSAGAEQAPAAAPERRRTPRRDAPLIPALRAEFTLLGRERSFSIDDLSLGGLGLRGPVTEGRGVHAGQRLAQVRLQLDGPTLVVDLEVRSRRSFRSFLAGEQVHIGCRFAGLPADGTEEITRVMARLAALRGEREAAER